MVLAKILDPETGLMDIQSVDFRQITQINDLRAAGYLDFVAAEQPQVNKGEKAIERIETINGKIVQTWTVITNDNEGNCQESY